MVTDFWDAKDVLLVDYLERGRTMTGRYYVDYYLFPKMKKELSGSHFRTDNGAKQAVKAFLEAQDATFYREGIHMLQNRSSKYVNLQGDYVEK